MPAIGILGGMGPQASARLYELLIQGIKQSMPAAVNEDYPEIVLFSVPSPNFMTNKKKIEPAKQMLIGRTQLLEQAGCVINCIACNTAHILLPELRAVTNVPFLAIPTLVADEVKAACYKRVGLLATPTTLSSQLYDEALQGIADLIRPGKDMAEQVEKYIYKQLNDSFTPSDQQTFRELVNCFMTEKQLDAVILGCTELPLVYGPGIKTNILDTLQLLAIGLLKGYFSALKK